MVPMSSMPTLHFFRNGEKVGTIVGANVPELKEKVMRELMNPALRAAVPHGVVDALLCGCDTGVLLTDRLSEHMGLPGNGTALANRRDKHTQQEAVRASGLRIGADSACALALLRMAKRSSTSRGLRSLS